MKFVKSIFTSFLSNMFGLIVSLLTVVVTARALSTSGNGIYNFSMVFIGLAGVVFGFGIYASNVYFIGKDRENINNVLGINFLVLMLAFLGNIILLALDLKFHFAFLKVLDGWSLYIVIFTVPMYILKTSLYYILLGIEEVTRFNKMNMLDKAVSLALLLAVLVVTKSTTIALLANLIAAVIMVVVIMVILFVEKGYRISFDKNITKGMFRYGFKSLIGNAIQNINYRLDVLITAAYLTSTAVGIYTKASNLGETIWRVSGSVGIVVLPYSANTKDKYSMTDFINKIIRITFAVIIIFSVSLTIICRPLIIFVLSKKFAGSVEPFRLLIPGISIYAIYNILNSYFAGSGMVEKNIIASGIAAVITVVLDFTLIPIYGIDGAAVTSSIAYTVCTIISLYFYVKHTNSKITDILIIKKSDIIEIKTKLKSFRKAKLAN